MAIGVASGKTGFDGNFSPIIYSKQAQIALRKASVANAITNNSYFGEIANQGDVVRIQKEPDVTVNALERKTAISVEDLDDSEFSLTIDKANYFAFKMDDIEDQFASVDFVSLAADRAAYKMADAMDADLLQYMSGHSAAGAITTTVSGTAQHPTANELNGEFLKANRLDMSDIGHITTSASSGTTGDSIPLAARLPGATSLSTAITSPLTVIARMARQMDVANVDSRGRWLVVDPVFMEVLKDEDSRLLNADFGGSGLQNGLSVANLHGFRVHTSNNLPSLGTGSSTTGGSNASNFGIIVAGHDSAVATAEQINKTETYRDPDSFADIVRGMHLYGRKILRPEAIVTAAYNLA